MGIRILCFLLCLGLFISSPFFADAALAQDVPAAELELNHPPTTAEKSTEKSTEKPKTAESKTADTKPDDRQPAKAAESEIEKSNRPNSSQLLPPSTKAWFSVPNVDLLEQQFDETQYGRLAAEPAIKPFVDSIKQQAQDWLDEKNVRLGIRVEDIDDIHTGEICIAGVLQDLEGGQPARGSHGLVLLVDVQGNEEKSEALLVKVNQQLETKKNAVQEQLEINGVPVTKLTIKNPKRIRHSQFSFQTVHEGWLLVADNEEIFRDILRRVSAPEKVEASNKLSSQRPFTEIMKQTDLFGNEAHFSWFVDPFGYLRLAQKIEEEEQDVRKHHDDWPRMLQEQGFDAIQGMGGNIALSLTANDQDFELLNRAYIFAPRENLTENQQHVFDMFDFQPTGSTPPIPAFWVPADASAYFAANWDFTKLLNGIGHVYDAFVEKKDGSFDRMIEDFKIEPDFQVDVRKIVSMLDSRLSMVSTTERPITEDSERMVVGLKLAANSDPDFIFQSIKRAVGRNNGKQINLGGFDVIEVDTTIESEPDELEQEFQLPPGFEDLSPDPNAAPAAPPKEKFSLFKRRYFVVHKGFLLVANDKLYLKKLLTSKQTITLPETSDFQNMTSALGKLTDPSKVCFRQFARVDRALETNYEMLRRNEMAKSETVLAKILNAIFEHENDQPSTKKPREQKLDGSKLPEDFEKSVAPYLGPSGWVLEAESDGWRVTGCALKKLPVNEVVKKEEATED